MPPPSRPTIAVLASALALGCGVAGCGKADRLPAGGRSSGPVGNVGPMVAQGAVSLTTRNTTRLGGADVASDAAAVARTVYPGLTRQTRPQVVALAEERDWAGALAASALAGPPLRAPLLFSAHGALPAVSVESLAAMRPLGAPSLAGAQVIRVGTSAAVPGEYALRSLAGGQAAEEAADVAKLLLRASAAPPRQAIVLPLEAPPALQMPAAGLAAVSGSPILFADRAGLPRATATMLTRLRRPAIYVIGSQQLGPTALRELSRLGRVSVITTGAATGRPGVGPAAVAGAIAVARFADGSFGWGIKEPGHGLNFASLLRPLDAPAAALLSASGDYGPLLLLESPDALPAELAGYLSDIQPAYTPTVSPVRTFYNHGWLIGDESAISAVTQAQIDSLLAVVSRKSTPEEQPGAPGE
jgi:hypothetical protein